MSLRFDQKISLKRMVVALYSVFWIIIALIFIVSIARMFPLEGDISDIVYAMGKIAGIFGLILLAFVITSKCFSNPFNRIFDPVRLYRAILILEVIALTMIFLHPIMLVLGNWLADVMEPFLILIPNLSTRFHIYVAHGCVAFLMLFVSGIVLMNRNSVRLNRHWKYIHVLIYPAFLLSLMHAHAIGSDASEPLVAYSLNLLYYAVAVAITYRLIELLLNARKRQLRMYREGRTPRKQAMDKAKKDSSVKK